MKHQIDEWLKKQYYLIGIIFLAIFADQFAVVIDCYIVQEKTPYYQFWVDHCIYGSTNLMWFGKLVLFGLFVLIFALAHNLTISVGIVNVLVSVLMFASKIKYAYRLELLNYRDFTLSGAGGMVTKYIHIEPCIELLIWAVYIGLSIFLAIEVEINCKQTKKELSKRKKWIIRGIIGLISGVFLLVYIPCFVNHEAKNEGKLLSVATDSVMTENKQYAIYRFCQSNAIGYSDERIQEAYENVLDVLPTIENKESIHPNVIVIMSEAWWDFDQISSDYIQYSQDPMARYKELSTQCVTGYVSNTIYGGGTVASEYEFLTGINPSVNSEGISFYKDIAKHDQTPSLVSYFHQMDYDCISLHPYDRDMYGRIEGYQALGFDKVMFEQDMKYQDKYDLFISDDAMAKQILYEYENKDDAPMFLFAISMASHNFMMPYEYDINYDYDYPISATYSDGTPVENGLVHCINGAYYAVEAYASLVDYFSHVDEPTVILMFGDHSPSLLEYNDRLGISFESTDINDQKSIHTTPVLMWKNYQDGGETVATLDGENIGYLDYALVTYAGLPESNMTRIVQYNRRMIKATSPYYTIDENDEPMTSFTPEQIEWIKNIKLINYDLLSGNRVCEDIWDPIIQN